MKRCSRRSGKAVAEVQCMWNNNPKGKAWGSWLADMPQDLSARSVWGGTANKQDENLKLSILKLPAGNLDRQHGKLSPSLTLLSYSNPRRLAVSPQFLLSLHQALQPYLLQTQGEPREKPLFFTKGNKKRACIYKHSSFLFSTISTLTAAVHMGKVVIHLKGWLNSQWCPLRRREQEGDCETPWGCSEERYWCPTATGARKLLKAIQPWTTTWSELSSKVSVPSDKPAHQG